MSPKISFALAGPDDAVIEVSIQMPLKDWRTLASQMDNNYPSLLVGAGLQKMISDAI